KGTVISKNDKGAVVTLPYGVEGFAPARHLKKEDNTDIVMDEVIDFKVIEFSKDNKRIVLSHNRIFQDKVSENKFKEKAEKTKAAKATKRAVKTLKDNSEKTTLGDLDALAQLKSKMDKDEKENK
ncbi:MAG: S1 RNA-binding domain-containing protein, partial [Bacteroidota bacterium]|nr:S1 RNA-binding domain-containing protein [Bacteroidota bacterium]